MRDVVWKTELENQCLSSVSVYVTLGHLIETQFLLLENGENISFLLYRVVVKSKKDRVHENVL